MDYRKGDIIRVSESSGHIACPSMNCSNFPANMPSVVKLQRQPAPYISQAKLMSSSLKVLLQSPQLTQFCLLHLFHWMVELDWRVQWEILTMHSLFQINGLYSFFLCLINILFNLPVPFCICCNDVEDIFSQELIYLLHISSGVLWLGRSRECDRRQGRASPALTPSIE